jgi:phosphotransacetylase
MKTIQEDFPDSSIAGPIQFDAAINSIIREQKLPTS